MEENKEEIVNASSQNKKTNKWRNILLSVICLVIILGTGNIYASTQGYGNVFFLIKYLVTKDDNMIAGKDEILYDKDITISYEAIQLTENLKMQIRSFIAKDNEAKLILAINEANLETTTKVVPLRYKVYNSSNELLCDKRSSKISNQFLNEYIEELNLKNYKQDDNTLILEVYKSNDEKLVKITIDLNMRQMTIDGEKEALQKISETELKKYLSYITKYEDCKDNDELKLVLLQDMFCNLKNDFGIETEEYGRIYEVSEINSMLDSLGFEKLPDSLNTGDLFKKIHIKGKEYYSIEVPDGVNPYAIINITDISYCAGLYTAEFIYMKANSDINFDTNYNNLEKIQATIYFKVNEDNQYSKFKVVKYESSNYTSNSDTSNNTSTNTYDNTIAETSNNTLTNTSTNTSTNITSNTVSTNTTTNVSETNTIISKKESTNDILNRIKRYLVEVNNNSVNSNSKVVITFRKYENGVATKDIDVSTAIFSDFIGKINSKVTEIDNSTTYAEWCNREVEKAPEEYIMTFMYDSHQTHILWDSNNDKEIDMLWHNNNIRTTEIDKIKLNVSAQHLFEELMEKYENY